MSTSQDTYRFVQIGLGAQGGHLLGLLTDLGHELVGAVDVGDKVGRLASEYATAESVPPVEIVADVATALDALDTPPDIVVLAAAVPRDLALEMAGGVLDRGVDVITLHPDLFERDPEWAEPLHARAVAGGASFLATGVQDTWWVHIPATIASSSVAVERIRAVSAISLEQLSATIGDMLAIGATPEEFAAQAEHILAIPAVLGGPLSESARRMGLTAGAMTRSVEPIIADEDYVWESAGITIPAGRVVGTSELNAFDTEEGIRFEGVLEVRPNPHTIDELHILGVPEHHLRYEPFDGHAITNVALVSRVPDVVEAAPGVLFSAELPVARHQVRRGKAAGRG